jgi:N-acyl-D-amino-acid deacylase
VELANVAGELNGVFQFNAFYNMIKPSTGFPAMLDRINARMIGNEFRLHPGETEQGPQALEYMAEMARKGKDVTGVVIPYQHIRRFDASGAFLFNGLPSWESVKGSPEALKRACADPAFRSRLELERNTDAGQPEHHTWTGWSGLVFERLDNPALGQLENKSVEQIALETGKNPADAFFDTWLADDLRSGLLYYGLANDRLDVLEDMITSPYGLIGTDAGAHLDRFFWHGTPARLLGYWCREKNLLGLEEAVWKLTGMPAQNSRSIAGASRWAGRRT